MESSAQPNGVRLSCGAEREGPQIGFYHTGGEDVIRNHLGTGGGSFKRVLASGSTRPDNASPLTYGECGSTPVDPGS